MGNDLPPEEAFAHSPFRFRRPLMSPPMQTSRRRLGQLNALCSRVDAQRSAAPAPLALLILLGFPLDVHGGIPLACGSGGSCFEVQGTPGCGNADCCAAVCTLDPFCCDVTWDTVCADLATAVCAPVVSAFGLPFTPLGGADLSQDGDLLNVLLDGPGGGVSIGLGTSAGIAIPAVEATGSSEFTIYIEGPFGCFDRFGYRVQGDGTIAVVTDPPCTEATFTAQLISEGQIVAQFAGLRSGELVLAQLAPDDAQLSNWFIRIVEVIVVEALDFISWVANGFGGLFYVVGSPGVVGETLMLIPDEPRPALFSPLESVAITAVGAEQLTFEGSPAIFVGDETFLLAVDPFERKPSYCEGRGQAAIAVGSAMISGTNLGNSLLIENLTSVPQSGAIIHVGQSGPVELLFGALPGAETLPTGAGMQVHYFGSVSGVMGQGVGLIDLVDTGDTFSLHPDFAEVGSPTYVLQILDQGLVIATLPGQSGAIDGIAALPSAIGRLWIPTTQTKGVNPQWTDAQNFVLDQTTYVGDELRILVESREDVVDFVSDVQVLAGGFDSMTILDVTLAPPVSRCPSDLNGDGLVDGADLGVVLGGWGQTGPGDLNGDGTVDGADLGLLLGSWGPCS